MSTPENIDRLLARTLRAPPLDAASFDAGVFARIEALPTAAAAAATGALDVTKAMLQRERRAFGLQIALYGIFVSVLLTVSVNVLDRLTPAFQWSLLFQGIDTNVGTLPIAALAVLASGAWLFARDRTLGVL